MIDRVEFAVGCWLTVGTIILFMSLAGMVKVDWKFIKQAYRRWRDSR